MLNITSRKNIMILKLIIKNNKKGNRITAWVQKHKDFEEDLLQIFLFFKDNINVSEIRRFHKYYKITSENPAIMMSLFSTIHDLILDIYFNLENAVNNENFLNIENL